jgi:hypothetical protein
MAFPGSFRCILVHYQISPLQVPRFLLQALPVDNLATSCFTRCAARADYGSARGVVL